MGSTSRSQSAWTPATVIRGRRRPSLIVPRPGCRGDSQRQQERHRGREQSGDGIGVAAPDGLLLALDLGRDVVETAAEGVDVAAELLLLVGVEIEGELHGLVGVDLVELGLDGGP